MSLSAEFKVIYLWEWGHRFLARVVGLIALPGAMTGLLLAGVEPMDAVLLQLIVMYMILGSATITVSMIVWFGLKLSLTNDLRFISQNNDI